MVHHHRCLEWYWYVAIMYWILRVISGGPFRGPLVPSQTRCFEGATRSFRGPGPLGPPRNSTTEWVWPRSRDATIFGSTVGYPSDSLASCSAVKRSQLENLGRPMQQYIWCRHFAGPIPSVCVCLGLYLAIVFLQMTMAEPMYKHNRLN